MPDAHKCDRSGRFLSQIMSITIRYPNAVDLALRSFKDLRRSHGRRFKQRTIHRQDTGYTR